MALNVGPLTTVFTPPTTCLNVVTTAASPFSTSYSVFIGHWGSYEYAALHCYPSSTKSIDYLTANYYWSPGYCPQGYTTACEYTAASLDLTVTASLCCPTGFDCAYTAWPHVCSSVATEPLMNVFVLTGLAGTLTSNYNYATLVPNPNIIVWNDGVPVAWESTDTVILNLIAGITTSLSGTSPTPGNSGAASTGGTAGSTFASSSTSSATNTASANTGFFDGNQRTIRLALIIAIPVGAILLTLIIFCFFRRYRQNVARNSPPLPTNEMRQENGFNAANYGQAIEADSNARSELGRGMRSIRKYELADNAVHELESPSKGSISPDFCEPYMPYSPGPGYADPYRRPELDSIVSPESATGYPQHGYGHL